MVKVRQDAWSHEDDLLLAETVLRHIREGSTQLKAFDEVGDHLNRTSAACGFRWNAEVRTKYIQAIEIAKRQRKEKKRALANQQQTERTSLQPAMVFSNEDEDDFEWDGSTKHETVAVQEPVKQPTIEQPKQPAATVSFDQVIQHMRELKSHYNASHQSQSKVAKLEQENETLRTENEKLEKQLSHMEKQYQTVQEDYKVLINIMDRARKMVVFDEDDQSKAAFRMEKNGNLEQVAR
ncbi:RsfA family transcriptional regulator [Pontibacillus yanchengensis]|uniref:Transcriptional regulator n=1 Tax=Pontibacillus yanchengensis Y32 TaxID=1385514 RepID=A0A0A2TP57_9BACI|nr:RsfA family transcriptional regulator [Pontibacillus yanchengensis]KGP71135.1 transcriptional regulator [Pontibacillus yanchengensis Y32]